MVDSNNRDTADEAVIPIVREQVTVGKEVVDSRTVTVATRSVVEVQQISEPVTCESVTVERVAVDRVVDAIPEVREDGDLTVIPVVEERLVVSKQLVLVEEIYLRRTREKGTEDRMVEVRRTEVDITE